MSPEGGREGGRGKGQKKVGEEGGGQGAGEKQGESNEVWLHLLCEEAQAPAVKGSRKYYQEVPDMSSNKVPRDVWTKGNKM